MLPTHVFVKGVSEILLFQLGTNATYDDIFVLEYSNKAEHCEMKFQTAATLKKIKKATTPSLFFLKNRMRETFTSLTWPYTFLCHTF